MHHAYQLQQHHNGPTVKTELLKLRDEGKLIVIACHDREELEFLCDIIYEIKNGTVAGCEVIGE